MEYILSITIILLILKLQFKMSDIQSVISGEEALKQAVVDLSGVTGNLIDHYAGLQAQVAALQAQPTNNVATQQQLDLLQADITDALAIAKTAKDKVDATLTPATPAPDPTPTPVPEPIPTPPAANPDAPVDPSVN